MDMTYLANSGPIDISIAYRRHKSNRLDITNRPGYFSEGTIIGNQNIWGPYALYFPKYANDSDNYAVMGKITLFNRLELGFNKLETNQGNGSVYPYDKTLPTIDWKFFRNIFHLRYQKDLTKKVSMNILSTYQYDGTGPDSTWAQGWNNGSSWQSSRTVEMLTWKYLSSKWVLFNDIVFKPSKQWILSGGFKYASGHFQKSYEFGRSDQITFHPGDTEYQYDVLFPQPLSSGRTPGNNYLDNEWGVYFQGKWSSKKGNLHLVAGARYDDNIIYGNSFNPRIGAVYRFNKNLFLKSNYGTAFQAPAPRNLYGGWGGLIVSGALKPDEIQTVDLSMIWVSSHFAHDVTLYYNEIKNSILQGENLPKKKISGLEFKSQYLFPKLGNHIRDFRIHFNYSYIQAKYERSLYNTLTLRSSDLIGGIAKHKFNMIVDGDMFTNLHVNIRFNYVGKRPTIVSNPVADIDGYFITNIGFQVKNIFNKISLFLNVQNLLDVDYYHPGYDSASAGENITVPSGGWYSSRLPQAGRTYMLGILLVL